MRDSAIVPLRDIARYLKIFVFLDERDHGFDDSMIMALSLIYYFRLNDKAMAEDTKGTTLVHHCLDELVFLFNGDIW